LSVTEQVPMNPRKQGAAGDPGFDRHDVGFGDESWRDAVVRAAVIVLAVLWVYAPVCHPVFAPEWLWDDDTLLTANPAVQSTTSAALAKLWFNPDGVDYFPLSYTALWLQWPLFGAWSTGYHVVSIALHTAGSLLLWRLLAVMRVPGCWLAGVIFAVHPVCVESVAWVSELKNTLSLPLFLVAATHFVSFDDLAHGRSVGATAPAGAERHYWLALLFFLLAMFAKTSVVMLPVVLLLHAWWKRGRVGTTDVVRAAPFFLVSLVLGLVTISFQHDRAIGDEAIPVGGLASRIATAGLSVLWYLRLLVWPVNLLPIYPRWEVDPPRVWQFLAWIPILGGLWACWRHRDATGPPRWERWGRHALFAFGFFLLMVFPVLGFVTIAYMRITWAADHFIYLPMIGPIALGAAALVTGAERLPARARPLGLAWTMCLLAGLAMLAYRYAGAWVNEDALWTHTLALNPDAWQAHNRLGVLKYQRGHIDDRAPPDGIRSLGALHHFTRSTALRPDLGETHNNLGLALSAKGRLAEAIDQFVQAARASPKDPRIRVNLANSLVAVGRFEEAGAIYEALLRMQPDNPALLNNLGVTLHRRGRTDEAIPLFRRALAIAPTLRDAQDSLAIALGEKPDPYGPAPTGPGAATPEKPESPAPAESAPPAPGS
jgi:lipoprotein NlpI